MELALAENIRKARKERQLTQEQLAEVLGVTAGAVYKWETGLSVPELELIVEMADFFDTSVDILLGYEMKDNRLKATELRLKELLRAKDPAGLAEAEKALKKYPNMFVIVHACAVMYWMFGMEREDKALYRRALTLLEDSRLLLPQNSDPEISELT
ncbi:MAG: helix-turn-helix transcriptional regulator, partial [Oscillospiraceae bacterium]|nr:helix-turn-helix transcriptional regulator [Oscillospiraceae bacterium]